jgi:O-antigen/teichoic acid export membrane protein
LLRGGTVRDAAGEALPLQVGQAVTIAVQGATSLVLLNALGPAALGVYAVSAALAATASIADLSGASRLAVTELAREGATTRTGRVAAILGRFIRTGVLVRVPVVAAFALLAPSIAQALYASPDAGRWARWLCLPLAIDLPYDLVTVVLHGRARMRQLARVESGRALLTALCTIAVLVAGLGLAGVVGVQVGASLCAALWALRAYRRLARQDAQLPPLRELIRVSRVPRGLPAGAGVAIAVEKNLGNLAAQLPMLLVGALRPDAAGYYAAALRTVSLPYPLVSAFARYLDVLLPRRAGESAGAARRAFVRLTVAAGGGWAIVTLLTILAAPFVLVRLAGEAYAPAVPALYPLALQSIATGAGVGIGAALRGLGRPSHLVALQAASIVLVLPAGYALVHAAGAVGAAWFHALRYAVLTAGGIGWVLWITRPAAAGEEVAVTQSSAVPQRGGTPERPM